MQSPRQHAFASALCSLPALRKLAKFLMPYPLIPPYANLPTRLPPRVHNGDSREAYAAERQPVPFLQERRSITSFCTQVLDDTGAWISIFSQETPEMTVADNIQKRVLLHNLCLAFYDYICNCVWVFTDPEGVWHATQSPLKPSDDGSRVRLELVYALGECGSFATSHLHYFADQPPSPPVSAMPPFQIRQCDINCAHEYVSVLLKTHAGISFGRLIEAFSETFLDNSNINYSAHIVIFALFTVLRFKHPLINIPC